MVMGRGVWRSSFVDPWVKVGNGGAMSSCTADKDVAKVSRGSDVGVDDESYL
jgi:hypothetical protein